MPLDFNSPLLVLVRQTKRYTICEIQPGIFNLCDGRCVLEQLLQFPELRPAGDHPERNEFDMLLLSLSPGPSMTREDVAMRAWLEHAVWEIDPKGENAAYAAAWERADVFTGTRDQVEYVLMAALNHRLYPTPHLWVEH